MNKNLVNIFKSYCLQWDKEHGINNQCICIQSLDSLRQALITADEIDDILNFFDSTMYLDIWIDISPKKQEYFLEKIRTYKNAMIMKIVDEMFYMGTTKISDFIKSEENEYIVLEKKEVTDLRKMKVLLLIAGKLDRTLVQEICKSIDSRLKHKKENVSKIKELWSYVSMDPINSSIVVQDKLYDKFEAFLLEHREYTREYKSDIIDLIDLLEGYNSDRYAQIKKLFM